MGWLFAYWDAPLVEDALFWFVPTALQQLEIGPMLGAQGALPASVVGHGPLPPQWAAGLPDYGHPPLWYGWLAAFLAVSPTLGALRAACVLPAAAAGLGFVALADEARRPWAGLAVWAIPGVLAQLLRPELDLPLLALVPLALVALHRDRWTIFAVLSVVATWTKEPGVLLVVPALVQAFRRRRLAWQVLAPVVALGVWAGVHGGLAPVLQRPSSWGQLGENLLGVGRFVFVDQGRFLLVFGAVGLAAAPLELATILVFALFFAYVRYYASAGTADAYTHLRYLLPAVAVYVVTTTARVRVPNAAAGFLSLVQLGWLHRVHVNGPEGSMAGIDAAYADRTALRAASGGEPWVGTYLAAGVGRTWTGYPDVPVRVYAFETTPEALAAGDLILVSTYGEPATRLERALRVEVVGEFRVGEVASRIDRVLGQAPEGWVPAVAPPR